MTVTIDIHNSFWVWAKSVGIIFALIVHVAGCGRRLGGGGGGKLTYLDQDVFVVDSCYTNDPKRATTIVPEHAIKFRNKKVCL